MKVEVVEVIQTMDLIVDLLVTETGTAETAAIKELVTEVPIGIKTSSKLSFFLPKIKDLWS